MAECNTLFRPCSLWRKLEKIPQLSTKNIYIEFFEAHQERAKELTSQKAFSKFQVMSHLEGTSVASRNGLLGAKTFIGKENLNLCHRQFHK